MLGRDNGAITDGPRSVRCCIKLGLTSSFPPPRFSGMYIRTFRLETYRQPGRFQSSAVHWIKAIVIIISFKVLHVFVLRYSHFMKTE